MSENRITKPVKICFKEGRGIRKSNRGDECDQNTMNACMEISQCTIKIL
jgi:hypothetical protein